MFKLCLLIIATLIVLSTAIKTKYIEPIFEESPIPDYYAFDSDFDQELTAFDYSVLSEEGPVIDVKIPVFNTPRAAMEHYFHDNTEAQHQMVRDIIKNAKFTPTALQHRASKVNMVFGMDLDDFEAVYEDYRTNLIKFATELDIQFNPFTTSYVELLVDCLNLITTQYAHHPQYDELMNRFEQLEEGRELFLTSITLLPYEAEDLVLQGIINLDNAIAWLNNYISSNKCMLCKKLVDYIRKKLCGLVGDYLCKLVAGAATPVLVPILITYGCGAPINLSRHLSNLCQTGVKLLQQNFKLTDTNICKAINFGTISLPKTNGFIVISKPSYIRIGNLC